MWQHQRVVWPLQHFLQLEVVHQGIFVHVLGLGDERSEFHTYYRQQVNSHRYNQYHEQCFQLKFLATDTHFYDKDNEQLLCLWCQQVLYLILQAAWSLLQ